MDIDTEVWSVVDGFPNYAVSNLGNVRNLITDRILKHNQTVYGDHYVRLYENGEYQVRSVRVMVATAFVFKPNDIMDTVIVLDGDRNNLKADNLSWKPRWYALKYAQKVDFDFEFDI